MVTYYVQRDDAQRLLALYRLREDEDGLHAEVWHGAWQPAQAFWERLMGDDAGFQEISAGEARSQLSEHAATRIAAEFQF